MLLSLQFPLVDLRPLQHEQTGQICMPGWPMPFDPERPRSIPFMRGFGPVRQRDLGGLEFWGEDALCDARRVLRWKGPAAVPRSGAYGQYAPLPVEVAFRSFYSDGAVVSKCEIGVATIGRPELHLDVERLTELQLWLLNHDVSLPNKSGRGRTVVPLQRASPLLQAALARATTRATWDSGRSRGDWIAGGEPMLFCQMRAPLESLERDGDSGTVRVDAAEAGISLVCFTVRTGESQVPLWVMLLQERADRTRARQLRLCLLRMHAEHEALRVVLARLNSGRISVRRGSPATERLQLYLRERHRNLFRNRGILRRLFETQSTGQQPIDELATGLMERLWPGKLSTLENMLQSMNLRRNIGLDFNADAAASLNIKEFYVANNVIRDVSGSNNNFVQGENNRQEITTNSGLADDKRKQLADLQKELTQATSNVPAAHKDAADAVVESAKDTVDKATREKPNATSVQISAKGMLEAANGIASVVPIALSIAEKIAKVVTGA